MTDLMVPEADFRSYYGRPILKQPVWTHDVAAYLFTGGLAAGSSLLAAGGDLTGRPALRRAGRLTALAALTASGGLLVKDLGRPERFLNMMRVAKPTSPMSMGTWILSAYGAAAGAAAVGELAGGRKARGLWRLLAATSRPAGLAAAATAPALGTYTAVLLANTAVPSWHAAHLQLPVVFGGSALASGAAVGLLVADDRSAGPARRMAVAGAALEVAGSRQVTHGLGLLSEPYAEGRPGRLLRAAEALTAAGALGALVGGRSRTVRMLSGACLLAGSAATRFGIFEGGVESTKDPKYVVVPQRERLQRRTPNGG